MKFLKIVLALLACLYVAFHVFEIPGRRQPQPGGYAATWWAGKFAGVIVATLVAASLFRSASR